MSKRRSRNNRVKLIILLILACLVLAGLANIVRSRLQTEEPSLKPVAVYDVPSDTIATSLSWPTFGQAAIGASGYGVLSTNGPQTPAPTASIAKLITALAVLKAKPLSVGSQGPTLVLGQKDVSYYDTYSVEDGSVALVAPGEQISEYQVIEAMLLPSANNMADSLANWAFGSLPAYKTYANHMLVSLGMTHTQVGSDASGFLPDTTSTASDLVRLGELAAANPIIAGIVDKPDATIPVAGTVKNVNWLLGTAGINGLKTGNTNQAGGVFIFSAPYQVAVGHKVTIIGAIMQAPTLQVAMDSSLPLLTSSQKAFKLTTVLAANQTVGQYYVPWAGSDNAIALNAVRSLDWRGHALKNPTIALANITIPQSKGVIVGTVGFNQDPSNTSSTKVILSQSIPKPSLWWRIVHG